MFRGVCGHEIVAGTGASLSTTASSQGDLEGPSLHLRADFDMCGVNADHKFPLMIVGQIKLDLLALVRMRRVEPRTFSRLLIETFAEVERAMANRNKGLRDVTGRNSAMTSATLR